MPPQGLFYLLLLLTCLAGGSATSGENVSLSQPQLDAASPVITFEYGKQPTREIHVAVNGSNVSGDGSASKPYAGAGRAAQEATPGTAIRIHAGTYTSRAYLSDLSGTAEAPIWVGGMPGEARPVFTAASEGLHLSRVRYLILHDIEVQHTTQNGINTDDGGDYADSEASRYLVFRNLYIHQVGSGGNEDCLKLSGINDYFVLDSEFTACGGGGSGSGIDHVGCHRGLIAGNYFHDLSANAVQNKGGSEDIEIRANRMIHSGDRAVNIGGSTGYSYFRPPLSGSQPNFEARQIRVLANWIEGSETPLAFVGAVDSLAANNTLVNPEKWLLRILQESVSGATYQFLPCGNNRVINNLFYFQRGSISTYVNIGPNTAPATFLFANNLWYAADNPAQSQPMLPVAETGGLVGQDPRLVNPAGDNYRLQSDSPAIARGLPVEGVILDYDGFRYNTPPSIGAFEGNPPALLNSLYLPIILREHNFIIP